MSPDQRDTVERITSSAQEALVRLRVRSALNPVLLACGVVTVPAIAGALLTSGPTRVAMLTLASLPVLVFCWGFVHFMFRDPDKLQSEDYQIQKRALDLIQEKGGPIIIASASIEAITNPATRMLNAGEADAT